MGHAAISTGAVIGVVVVIIVVAAGAFFVLGGLGGTQTVSTSKTSSALTSSSATGTQTAPPSGVQTAFQTHLQRISSRDIPTVLTDYQQTAVVVWEGNAQGLQGTYNGVGNVKLLYATALGTASTIKFNSTTYKALVNSSSEETIIADIKFFGNSQVLGAFNGTLSAKVVYDYVGTAWQIKQETWNFHTFYAANAGEATTFPQWQKVGPIRPERRSLDPLHNFAWDFGGPGAAGLVYMSIAAITFSFLVTRVRKR